MSDNEPDVADLPAVADPPAVTAVSLKLPAFWPDRAEVWFLQAESQFATRGIQADATRYHYIVAALDQDTATRVLDLLLAPPATDKYTALKARLLETFTLTDSQRAARLLAMPGLGDERPAQLMDKMLALLGDHPPCFLFRELFLQQLPTDIRAHLIHAGITDVRALARDADALWLSSNVQHVACKAGHREAANSTPVPTRRVSASIPRTSTLPLVPAEPAADVCFYHQRFGAAARQCRPPCSFSVQGNAKSGRQ